MLSLLYREKLKTMFHTNTRDSRGIFRYSYHWLPEIDIFTDEPVVLCDVQVVENTFVDNFK